jgi:hypothetical protein
MANQLIWYVRGSGDVRSDLIEDLRKVGYTLEVTNSVDVVVSEIKKKKSVTFIIIDASAGEAEASNRIVELSASDSLFETPLILISYQAGKRSPTLKKKFKTFIPVDIPFKVSSIIEQLIKLAPPAGITSKGSEAETKSKEKKKGAKTSGGEHFAYADEITDFDDSLLIPEHPTREKIINALQVMSKRNDRLPVHARRVTFITSSVSNSLQLSREQDFDLRRAALILNYGSPNSPTSAHTQDLFHSSVAGQTIPQETLEHFRKSADFARDTLNDKTVEKIILTVVALLSGEDLRSYATTILPAQCILATELCNRATWGHGTWDPHGAYRAVRKMKDGVPVIFDPSVIEALSKILSEAAVSRHSLLNFYPTIEEGGDNDQNIKDASEESEMLFGDLEQIIVEIPDLRPGMRLAKPIIANDGKLILRSNIQFTTDIIWRLWQLATVRPLRPPISVLVSFSKSN